jgi:hypothetical protein
VVGRRDPVRDGAERRPEGGQLATGAGGRGREAVVLPDQRRATGCPGERDEVGRIETRDEKAGQDLLEAGCGGPEQGGIEMEVACHRSMVSQDRSVAGAFHETRRDAPARQRRVRAGQRAAATTAASSFAVLRA